MSPGTDPPGIRQLAASLLAAGRKIAPENFSEAVAKVAKVVRVVRVARVPESGGVGESCRSQKVRTFRKSGGSLIGRPRWSPYPQGAGTAQ